jgi:hypothetical protein
VGDEIEKNKKIILSLPVGRPSPRLPSYLKKMTAGRLSPQAGLGGANNLSLPTPF